MNDSRFNAALEFLEKEKDKIREGEDSILAEWYIEHGVITSLLDKQDSAFSSLQNAIDISKRIRSKELEFKANTQLIELYRRNRLYEQALFLIRKLRDETPGKSPILVARFLHRSAAVYNETPQQMEVQGAFVDTAIALSELSLEISKRYGFKDFQSTSLNELGNIYERTGYFDKAWAYYIMSINLRLEKKDIYLANAVKNLGSYYLRRNIPDSALYYFNMVLEIIKDFDLDHQIYADTHWGLMKAYEAKGDSINYLKNKILEAKHASLLTEERLKKKIIDQSLEYEEKERRRLEEERLKKIQEERRNNYILSGIGIFILFLLLLYLFKKRRNSYSS